MEGRDTAKIGLEPVRGRVMPLKQERPVAASTRPGALINVRVHPRGGCDRVEGYRGGALRVRVTAAPEDGKANSAVVSLLAKTLGVAKSNVQIVRGHGSRDKVVAVETISQEYVERRLTAHSGP